MTHTETQAMCERIRKLVDYYDELDPEDYPDSEPMEFTLGEARALSALITRQQEEIERLRSAIEPFSDFARWTIDENGWSGSAQREQIHTWFGPSDFRAALQAKPDEGVNETFTLSDEVKPACDSEDPTEMCLHCHCWKFTRATCK